MAIGVKMSNWSKANTALVGKGGRFKEDDRDYVKKYPDKVIFRRLLEFLKPYKQKVFILVACLLITSITQLAYPIGMMVILQIVYPMSSTSEITNIIQSVLLFFSDDPYVQLFWVGFILFLSLFINFYTKRTYHYNMQKLSQALVADLRFFMFNHIQNLSLQFYTEVPAGKVISRLTNDVGTVQALISTEIVQAIGDLFTIIATLTLMFMTSWKLTLYIALFAPLFGLVFYLFSRRSRKYWIKERQTVAELTGILQEAISGSKTIKAFVTENDNIGEFSNINQANKDISLKAARLHAMLHPITQLMVAAAIGLVIYIGSIFVQSGDLTISLMLGYVVLAQQFMNPLNNLGTLYNNAQQALAAGDRILTIIDTKATVVDDPNAKSLSPIKGHIVFDHVNFHYVDNIPVLSDICLDIAPNQRIAIVGYTGAGKTTLISLLSRFYDPTAGKLLIDDIDIKSVTMKSLQSQMGIVTQDTFLFSGTIMDNIRYGRLNATDEEVFAAAKKVGADLFISRLPEGYQTDVRERGGLLSVGQRQLISFARALLADPRILILDEATSSVDPYTELKIQEALEILLQGRNSLIIAHRLSTILNSDRIIVIEQGQVSQQGTHDELLHKGGLYKHLYEMQFKEMNEKESKQKNET